MFFEKFPLRCKIKDIRFEPLVIIWVIGCTVEGLKF